MGSMKTRRYKATLIFGITLLLMTVVLFASSMNTKMKVQADYQPKEDKTITVYAHVVKNNGYSQLYLTSASYFDKTGYLDDGSPEDYNLIAKAMRDAGLSEERESMFASDEAINIDSLTLEMNKHDISVSFDNTEFNEFCER